MAGTRELSGSNSAFQHNCLSIFLAYQSVGPVCFHAWSDDSLLCMFWKLNFPTLFVLKTINNNRNCISCCGRFSIMKGNRGLRRLSGEGETCNDI